MSKSAPPLAPKLLAAKPSTYRLARRQRSALGSSRTGSAPSNASSISSASSDGRHWDDVTTGAAAAAVAAEAADAAAAASTVSGGTIGSCCARSSVSSALKVAGPSTSENQKLMLRFSLPDSGDETKCHQ